MKGEGATDINFVGAKNTAIVTDIVYNPLETEFLADAKNKSLKTITGIGMLVYQAVPGFKKWFGEEPNVSRETFEYLERALIRKELHSE